MVMDISSWDIFYKYKQGGKLRANLVYVPRISPDRNVFCMDFNIDKRYFFDRTLYTDNIAQFYFDNEIRWLEHFQNKTFAPDLIDIDKTSRRVFFKWYDTSLNHILEDKKTIDEHHNEIKNILAELSKTVLKINYYPHTTYVDLNNNIRVHDFYGCVSNANSFLPMNMLTPILGKMDIWRFEQYNTDGLVDMKQVYALLLQVNSGEWPFEII
jgi:hypothetical protein